MLEKYLLKVCFFQLSNSEVISLRHIDIKTTDSVDQLVLFACCFNQHTSRQPRQNYRSRKMLHKVMMK